MQVVSRIARTADWRGDDRRRFARVLVDSIPAEERDDPAQVLENIDNDRRWCVVTREEAGLVGFAVLLEMPSVDAVLLEYFAVDESCRDRGVGGHLFDHVVDSLTDRARPPSGLALEVERPGERSGEHDISRRRVAFYERHGATLVDDASGYRVPATTGPATLDYQLMWVAIEDRRPLDTERLREIAVAILTSSYGLSADDAFVRSVVADLVA